MATPIRARSDGGPRARPTTSRTSTAKALAELTRLGASGPASGVEELVVRDACALLGCDFAALLRVAPDSTFTTQAVYGNQTDTWNLPRTVRPGGAIETAMISGRAVIQHLEDLGQLNPASLFIAAERAATWLCAPLVSAPGVLFAGWIERSNPTDDQAAIAETLASYAGTILESTRARQAEAERTTALQAVLDCMPSGVYLYDAEGRLVLSNAAALGIVGRAPTSGLPAWERFAGSGGLRSLISGKRLGARDMPPARVLSGEEDVRDTIAFCRAGETQETCVMTSAAPLKDSSGAIVGAVSVITDITQEMALQRQLEDQLTFAQAAMASLGEGIYATDERGAVTFMNQAAEELLGWSGPELLGKLMHDVCHHSTADGAPIAHDDCRVKQARIAGATYQSEDEVFVRRDGSLFPVSYTASPLLRDGQVRGMVVGFRDITERRQVELALRASEDRYRTMVETAFEGIWVIDADHRTAFANEQLATLLGCTVEEIMCRPPHDFLHTDDHAFFETRLHRRAAGVSERYEAKLRRLDGGTVSVSVSACPLRDSSGVYSGSLSMITDLTERKHLDDVRRQAAELEAENRRIAEAAELRAKFFATMSHELRSPLHAIIGLAELIDDGSFGPLTTQQRDMTGRLVGSSEHLLKLVNGVLDLAKIEAGKLELEPEQIALPTVVHDALEALRPAAHAKDVALDQAIDPGLGSAYLDPTRLRQVLYNYVSNAIKFSPPGARVTVRLMPHSDAEFRIEIEDHGPGIASDDLDKLFREFTQLTDGQGAKEKGTGLGLAITKRIVEAQGGSVGVTSEPGKGSVFYAILPLRCPSPTPGGAGL